ncbi:MAG: type II toxin-antitoxin system HicA family toxin [Dehalococcoidia bacterium]|nr:type II toxin-antitoxin system HicA family toxin [Dehalococcoidia bacterium]
MKPKLPTISGAEAIKAFQKIGYEIVRRRGSHVRMRDRANPSHKPLSIPDHKELKPGLLRRLLRDADLDVERFLDLLKRV